MYTSPSFPSSGVFIKTVVEYRRQDIYNDTTHHLSWFWNQFEDNISDSYLRMGKYKVQMRKFLSDSLYCFWGKWSSFDNEVYGGNKEEGVYSEL